MKNKDRLELFVGGLSPSLEEQEIRELFAGGGVTVLTVRILCDRFGKSKRVSFILCADYEHANRALSMNETFVGDKKIRVHLAEKRD